MLDSNIDIKLDSTRTKGDYYEKIAMQYLVSIGFSFMAKNFYTKYGEIDLVMKKDSILHFIEVKSSSCLNPLLNITPKKLQRLTKAIHVFIANQGIDCDFCIDAISIYKDNISFIENITFYI